MGDSGSIGFDNQYNRFDPRHPGNAGNIVLIDGSARTTNVQAWVPNDRNIWWPYF